MKNNIIFVDVMLTSCPPMSLSPFMRAPTRAPTSVLSQVDVILELPARASSKQLFEHCSEKKISSCTEMLDEMDK